MQGRELVQFVTDFTWYLRNLMLVKSSDDLEDVIDMSTDNLARLKEEAELIETDRIIRYIRIFSELSGQIRYAAQKRILVEIALIKLCKPAMETSQEALLDRIRDVEDKLEKGVIVTEKSATSIEPQNAVQTAQAAPTGSRMPLPAAVPEDIRKIVAQWPGIINKAGNPMKFYLQSARLSLGGDNKLMVVLEDGIASDYFGTDERHAENKKLLERLLSDFVGKEVEVTIQSVKTKQEFAQNYVDLSQVIHMEIEEEDDLPEEQF